MPTIEFIAEIQLLTEKIATLEKELTTKDERIKELEADIVRIRKGHQSVIDLANAQHIRIAETFEESTDQFFDVFANKVIQKYTDLQARIKELEELVTQRTAVLDRLNFSCGTLQAQIDEAAGWIDADEPSPTFWGAGYAQACKDLRKILKPTEKERGEETP